MATRTRAVQKMLRQSTSLFEKCRWCECDIVWHQKLPEGSILNLRQDGTPPTVIFFKLAGRRFQCPIVTVDHVLEISKGGDNNGENLVLSCAKCNAWRSSPREPRKICIQCGQPKPDSKRKRCKQCIHDNRKAILTARGVWDEEKHQRSLKQKKKRRRPIARHIPYPFNRLFALYEDPIYRQFLMKVADC